MAGNFHDFHDHNYRYEQYNCKIFTHELLNMLNDNELMWKHENKNGENMF